jgi:hypothetical protein
MVSFPLLGGLGEAVQTAVALQRDIIVKKLAVKAVSQDIYAMY